MVDIDPYLAFVDNDRNIQKELKRFADDAFNNNEFLIHARPEENEYFSELISLIEPIVERNKDTFLNEEARSATFRLDYPHLYGISKHEDKERFIQNLVRMLIICLANEKQKHSDDYVRQLLDNNAEFLPHGVELAVSKEGLINISQIRDQIEFLDHAIDLKDKRRIYLHQFLRRHFNSNFVDIPRILDYAVRQGLKVEVRLDPFRVGVMSRYRNIMECDAWFGPKFNQRLLDSEDEIEKVTIHHFNGDSVREKVYNQYITIFRTSMLDSGKGFRQFFVEEYPPFLDWKQSSMPGVGEKYVIQRFAHFVYDQNSRNFEHIDCAVRIFSREEYDAFYEIANQGNDPGGRIGKRFKLFKISGGVDDNIVQRSLYAFFRGNIHLQEYFKNVSFNEADKLLRSE